MCERSEQGVEEMMTGRTGEQPVRLFHGTTAAAANRIVTEGFKAPDIDRVLHEVGSVRHEVPLADLLENLQLHSSYIVSESRRGSRVSFTPNRENVESTWAQNAPEHLREALWAVWRVNYSNSPDPYAWAQDVAGHAWVIEQLSVSEPVVLEFEVGLDELVDLGAQFVSFNAGPLTQELLPLIAHLPRDCVPDSVRASR